jgi:hypothetical protein
MLICFALVVDGPGALPYPVDAPRGRYLPSGSGAPGRRSIEGLGAERLGCQPIEGLAAERPGPVDRALVEVGAAARHGPGCMCYSAPRIVLGLGRSFEIGLWRPGASCLRPRDPPPSVGLGALCFCHVRPGPEACPRRCVLGPRPAAGAFRLAAERLGADRTDRAPVEAGAPHKRVGPGWRPDPTGPWYAISLRLQTGRLASDAVFFASAFSVFCQ